MRCKVGLRLKGAGEWLPVTSALQPGRYTGGILAGVAVGRLLVRGSPIDPAIGGGDTAMGGSSGVPITKKSRSHFCQIKENQ